MFKSKAKIIAVTFIIFVVSILTFNSDYAQYYDVSTSDNNETADMKVTFTNDTKELKDTQEINFKVEDNPNVVAGKFAPGCKATTTIEVSINETKGTFKIIAHADTSSLPTTMNLSAKIDDEFYELGSTKIIKLEDNDKFADGKTKKIITLELEWAGDSNADELDTAFGTGEKSINIPVTIQVSNCI